MFSSKIYVEPARNGLTTIESSETSVDSQTVNGFAVPHNVNDSDLIHIESQETQAGSTTNTQLDDEMQQDENDEEVEDEDDDIPEDDWEEDEDEDVGYYEEDWDDQK
ncbi:MAG: hypothetical protein BGN96_17180 [Bacteroidales bacterium 45-6]|nr:MAG: hypothetical protein BGN96_17180 [Bacteroidales bacterium 45-6]